MTREELVTIVRRYGVRGATVAADHANTSVTLHCGGDVSVGVTLDDVRYLFGREQVPPDVVRSLEPYMRPETPSPAPLHPAASEAA